MADAREAWNTTGERFAEIGRKLKVHYEAQRGDDVQQSRQELTDAARKVGGALQDAFEALGAAARDTSVQAEVKQAGRSLVDALGATLGQASDEVRRALSERKGEAGPARAASPDGEVATPAGEAPKPADGTPKPADGEGKVEPWGTP